MSWGGRSLRIACAALVLTAASPMAAQNVAAPGAAAGTSVVATPAAPPKLSFESHYLVDFATDKVLAANAADVQLPPASLTKLMTAYVVFGALEGVPGGLFAGGLVDHVAALILAFAISYPFYAARGLKAGDAKLLMAIGALRGVNFLLFAAVYGAVIGGILAVGFIVSRKLARPTGGAAPSTFSGILKSTIPYGVALGIDRAGDQRHKEGRRDRCPASPGHTSSSFA